MRMLIALVLLCSTLPAAADEPCINIVVETTGTPSALRLSPLGWPLWEELDGVTIEVQLLDCDNNPIAWYPAQDIWLDGFIPGEISLCPNQLNNPPYGTDATGRTTFEDARLTGGGYTTGGTMVFVGGQPASVETPLPIQFVSADLNGDLEVDIADLAIFGRDWQTGSSRSDFDGDGVVDLPDFSHLGVVFGTGCR